MKSWLKRRVARRVLVHTIDEHTFEGLLVVVAGDGLVLRAARHIDEGPDGKTVATPLQGEVWIDRLQVRLVQVLDET